GTPAKDILADFKGQKDEAKAILNMLDHVYATGELFTANEFKTSFDPEGTGELEEGYFTLIYQPLENAERKVYGLFITGYEVTGQVKARQVMAEQDRRLSIALESAKIGFWEVDIKNSEFAFISDQLKSHFGHPPEETFTYKDFVDSVHPDDLLKIKN